MASEQDSVVVETEIAAPPERVFQALVDQKQLFIWWGRETSLDLTSFEMSPKQGGTWQFKCKPKKGQHEDIAKDLASKGEQEFEAHGEVLESIPPRLLVWSWIANYHTRPDARTIVKWELEPTAAGTRVRVTHSGLADMPANREGYGNGWIGVLALLRGFAEEILHGHSQWTA